MLLETPRFVKNSETKINRVSHFVNSLGLEVVREKTEMIAATEEKGGGHYLWPMDIFIPALNVYVDLYTGDDKEDKFRSDLYSGSKLTIIMVDEEMHTWQNTLIDDLQTLVRKHSKIVADIAQKVPKL